MDAVMRLLKGEDLDSLSRELRVNAAMLSSWCEVFLSNGFAGLKSREVDARDEKIGALQKALGETTLNLEISKEINRVYETKHRPLAPAELYNEQWLVERHGSEHLLNGGATTTLQIKKWRHDRFY